MNTERIILRKPLRDLPDVEVFFKKLSGIDTADIPGKYGDSVVNARKAVMEKTEIAIVCKCEAIKSITEDQVLLECGLEFTGNMAPRILKNSEQVVNYVISLCGYTETVNETEDVMEEYFLDTWGSAYVECAQAWLGRRVLEELKLKNKSRTHLWSPGQHQFELRNQKTLFEILHPETIGCKLSRNLMMIPVKSASGIMGIVEEGTKEMLLPCDFCSFGGSCPASKRGCAEL